MDKVIESRIKASLRSIWMMYSKDRKLARENAKVSRGIYHCSSCKERIRPKRNCVNNIFIDHIDPIVPVDREIDIKEWIDRLFCGVENLQLLCKSCHDLKTKRENNLRTKFKKEKSLSK